MPAARSRRMRGLDRNGASPWPVRSGREVAEIVTAIERGSTPQDVV